MKVSQLLPGLLLAVTALATITCSGPAKRGAPLFLFADNGRWGYLDSTGAVVIPARFWAAGAFAEGLAPVREKGLYGYLDATGKYVLAPAYEYATSFTPAGTAVVWQANKPQLINRAGQVLVPAGAYRSLQWIADERGRPLYLLASGGHRYGLLTAQGQVLLDTLYDELDYRGANRFQLTQQLWVRERTKPDSPTDTTTTRERGDERLALADQHGRLLVPFGHYTTIATFKQGVAVAVPVHGNEEENIDTHLLDTLGRVVAVLPGAQFDVDYDARFQDGVLAVYRRGRHLYGPKPAQVVALNRHGRVLFADTALETISPYVRGRDWAKTHKGDWYLLDKAGRRLNARPWRGRIGSSRLNDEGPAFSNGVEVVWLDSTTLQLINNAGQAVGPARHIAFANDDATRQGSLVQFVQNKELPNGHYETRLGYWDLATGYLCPPTFGQLAPDFRHGLLSVRTSAGQSGFVNRAGRLIWVQATAIDPKRRLNVDFLNRSGYTAASPDLRRLHGAGGWGGSGNGPHQLPGAPATPGQLRVSVATQATDTLYAGRFAGHSLYISNATADTVLFAAQDSRLHLLVQARDAAGHWQAIEYYPNSWCGNSYHTLFLAPGQYWQLAVPAYTGSQPTRLRVAVSSRSSRQKPTPTWYSNEFEGSVNPGQFWRRAGYTPQDIMDPYWE